MSKWERKPTFAAAVVLAALTFSVAAVAADSDWIGPPNGLGFYFKKGGCELLNPKIITCLAEFRTKDKQALHYFVSTSLDSCEYGNGRVLITDLTGKTVAKEDSVIGGTAQGDAIFAALCDVLARARAQRPRAGEQSK